MKYEYTELIVMCYEAKIFRIDRLREAVDYLKQQPQTGFVGLVAVTLYTSPEYGFQLRARPTLPLERIAGKRPAEVWPLFDHKVDQDIFSLKRRFTSVATKESG